MLQKVSVAEKLAMFTELWTPKIIGQIENFHVKLSKFDGPFVWHSHPDEDEMFLVVEGAFTMELRDGNIDVGVGEFLIVPKGVEHRPVASSPCSVLLFEPASTVNTGNAGGDRTVVP